MSKMITNCNNKTCIIKIKIHKEKIIMKSNIFKIKILNLIRFNIKNCNNIITLKVTDKTTKIFKALIIYSLQMKLYNCKDRRSLLDSEDREKIFQVRLQLEAQIKPRTLYISTKKERVIVVIIIQILKIKMIKNYLGLRDLLF